jgi:hypothetical protein
LNVPRILTVLGATAAALVVWLVAGPLAGLDLNVSTGEVGVGAVIATPLIAGLAGWGLLALLERTAKNPRRLWTTIAVVFLVISLAGPLTLAATVPAMIALACMHLVTGAVLIPLLPRPRASAV